MSFFGQLQEMRSCSNCGSDKTRTRKDGKWPHWYKDGKGGYLCTKCYNKLVTNPRWHKINNPKWNPITRSRMIVFKGKPTLVKNALRIGVCNWCRAVIGETNAQTDKICKQTQIHHEKYEIEDPTKNTIELCVACHTNLLPSGNTIIRQCSRCGANLNRYNWSLSLQKRQHTVCNPCDALYQRQLRKR